MQSGYIRSSSGLPLVTLTHLGGLSGPSPSSGGSRLTRTGADPSDPPSGDPRSDSCRPAGPRELAVDVASTKGRDWPLRLGGGDGGPPDAPTHDTESKSESPRGIVTRSTLKTFRNARISPRRARRSQVQDERSASKDSCAARWLARSASRAAQRDDMDASCSSSMGMQATISCRELYGSTVSKSLMIESNLRKLVPQFLLLALAERSLGRAILFGSLCRSTQ